MNNLNTTIQRGDTYFHNMDKTLVVIYSVEKDKITIVQEKGMEILQKNQILENYTYKKLTNYFYINERVNLEITHDINVLSMNGVSTTIKKNRYLNQINDIYVNEMKDFLDPTKRVYVFDFDNTGRDYVEMLLDYSHIRIKI